MANPPLKGDSSQPDVAAVTGNNDQGGLGVFGQSSPSRPLGQGTIGTGFVGGSAGVYGDSILGNGVLGTSWSDGYGAVAGTNHGKGPGIYGDNIRNRAYGFLGGTYRTVQFITHKIKELAIGVFGQSNEVGVYGVTTGQDKNVCSGVYGKSASGTGVGVHGHATTTGIGVYGTCDIRGETGGFAGLFDGDVQIDNGKLYASGSFFDGHVVIQNSKLFIQGDGSDAILADCSEEFELSATSNGADPGSVMVLDETGTIFPCNKPYDRRVAGVFSGAGPFQPAIVLDRSESASNRAPIALIGKVCCLVDATYAPVEVGDLLTTSPTMGHAMKADDPAKAFGAVIGKALAPIPKGRGLIPILVTLQ